MSSSGVPPSMGPGARSVSPSSSTGSNVPVDSIISQVREIRSHYSITLDDSRSTLNIGYDLKNRTRSFSLPFASIPINPSTQWLLYGGPARRLTTGTFVTDIIRGAENMAQRDLTQAEAEGHALHASRRMMYGFAAMFSSATIGAGMALVGRQTMKFPFRKPKPIEKYNNFPGKAMPILTGRNARVMWHITRANVYTLFAFLLLQPLYSSMGDNALMVGLYRDERTQKVLKEMKANKDPNRAFQISRIGSNVERDGRGQIMSQGRSTPQQQGNNTQYEDPDPQGYYRDDANEEPINDYTGARSYDSVTTPSSSSSAGDTSFTDGSTDTAMLTDRQMAAREAQQDRNTPGFTGVPAYQRGVQQKTQQQQQQQQYERDRDQGSVADEFLFDDASPSGGRGMSDDFASQQQQQQQTVTKSGMGGAWNRVRRGQQVVHSAPNSGGGRAEDGGRTAKGGARQGRGTQAQMQSSADGFSFSKTDEERGRAKEEAQREFDRMVEAERRGSGEGGGFGSAGGNSGGAGGGGAWGGRSGGGSRGL